MRTLFFSGGFLKGFILALILSLVACTKVPPGNVGVKVYLLGGSKGVDHEVLGVGRYWIGWNEELFIFPTFQQNYVWTKSKEEGSDKDESITFQTREGLTVNADVGISYSIRPEKVSDIFQKYRRGIDEITNTFLRNAVRDSFNSFSSKMSVEDVYGAGKEELLKAVHSQVSQDMSQKGIVVDKIYLIGQMRLPDTIIAALNSKIEATQRAQQRENEVQEARAEADKQVAQAEGKAKSLLEVAKAEAEANRLRQQTLTAELIQYETVKKWDGKLPQYSGGGSVPLLNIR